MNEIRLLVCEDCEYDDGMFLRHTYDESDFEDFRDAHKGHNVTEYLEMNTPSELHWRKIMPTSDEKPREKK